MSNISSQVALKTAILGRLCNVRVDVKCLYLCYDAEITHKTSAASGDNIDII